jgi:hypothetical protein
MGYAMPANVSFCLAQGRAVFLDLAQDRYFRLSGALDAAFQSLCRGDAPTEELVEALVQRGAVRRTPSETTPQAVTVTLPTLSALETQPAGASPGAWATLRVVCSVLKMRLALKVNPLLRVVDQLRTRRTAGRSRSQHGLAATNRADILAAAARFNRARRVVPIDTVCLLDAFALMDFLLGAGLSAELVMGVKLNPFSAHCWVQYEDVILNDAFDRASAFTPILVV